MPTDNIKCENAKLYFKLNETDEVEEFGKIAEITAENAEVCNDDAADAVRYFVETKNKNIPVLTGGYSIETAISSETGKMILKAMGENRITRKRFIKLLMGNGIQRNMAQNVAEFIHILGWRYTPNLVKMIILNKGE